MRSTATGRFELKAEQIEFFKTFGFVKLPGLFADEADDIRAGFEEAFADEDQGLVLDPENRLHRAGDADYRERPRVILPTFIDRSPKLNWIRDDPRTVGVAEGLLGPGFGYAESDGNLFNCDVLWHRDIPMKAPDKRHIKMYFYLDSLDGQSGALRMIPGSHHTGGPYTARLWQTLADPDRIAEFYGMGAAEVPSWTVPTEPGDLVVGDYQTLHGSFGGAVRRRLFTVNFSAA